MKNILSHIKPRGYKYKLDIVETEISDWQSRIYLPHHISAPETKSHRVKGEVGTINHLPKICRIESEKQNNDNIAVNVLKYQLSDRTSRKKHFENLRHNLEHRLQVAKSQGDSRLLDILQDEYKQLEINV